MFIGISNSEFICFKTVDWLVTKMEQLMKFKVKKEQISDDEDEVKQQEIKLLDVKKEVQEINVKKEQSDEEIVQQQQFNNRPDVKAETPAEYLLIIPPEEYPEQAATFKCDYEDCNYAGRTKTNLEIHQNTHTKPFGCSYCDKRFGTNEILTNHELVQHEDPNAFQCHICKKNLTSKKNLKRHIQTHQATKPFECPKCLKKFRAKHLLNLHQRNMHSGNQFIELVVPICSSMCSFQMPNHSSVICVRPNVQIVLRFASTLKFTKRKRNSNAKFVPKALSRRYI